MDFLHRMIYTAVGAISIFYFFVRVSLSHWKKRGILHEKPKFLWGNLKGVGSKRHISTALDEIYKQYKGKAPFIGFYAWLRPLVFILDVELVRRILIVDAAHFEERGLYHNIHYDPLSENLIQLDRSAYKKLYSEMAPCFSKMRLQSMFPALLRVADVFHRAVASQHEKNEIFNIKHMVSAYNTDVVSLLAFGLETDSLTYPNTEFRCMSRNFVNKISLIKLYLAWSFPNIARTLCFRIYNEKATDYFVKLVQKQLELRSSDNYAVRPYSDFLQFFVETKYSDDDDNFKNRIAAQCFSWLLAGLEASNTTLTMCLYELSVHPDIQDKARTEIEAVITEHKDKLTVASLNDMTYLKKILCETLRKHCPYPFLLRNTLKDYEISDSVFMLQEGNSIIIPISSIHHDPTIYPNPQRFDPSRFDASEVAQRNPAAFLPFGAGPRACLVQEFVEMQMLVCLVTLLLQYRFTSCSETPILLQYDQKKLMVTPKTPIELRLERI